MQKMMILMKVSPVMEREFTTSNNEVRKVKYRMLTLDDGIDSIYGETSEALCNRIDTTNEQNRLQLVEGHLAVGLDGDAVGTHWLHAHALGTCVRQGGNTQCADNHLTSKTAKQRVALASKSLEHNHFRLSS